MTTKIEEFQAKKEEFTKMIKKEGKAALIDSFKEVFDAVPELETLVFTQYTPHFNDGEPCTFSVHEFNATFNVPILDQVHKGYEGPGRYDKPIYVTEPRHPGEVFDEVSYGSGEKGEDPVLKETRKALKTLNQVKNDCEEIFEAAFGDGVEVTATRNGFDVEEHDHD